MKSIVIAIVKCIFIVMLCYVMCYVCVCVCVCVRACVRVCVFHLSLFKEDAYLTHSLFLTQSPTRVYNCKINQQCHEHRFQRNDNSNIFF